MQTLVIVKTSDHQWLRELFNGRDPLLVTLCNKPLVEYLVDFTILAGGTAMRIATDGSTAELEQYCGNGSRWGIELSYGHIHPSDDRQTVQQKNRRFCSEGRTVIIERALLAAYDKRADYRSWIEACPAGTCMNDAWGSITLTGEPSHQTPPASKPPLGTPRLDSIADYFALSMEVLGSAERYILPGYSNEPDCAIGRNVLIQKGASITKPVIIGNNVQIMAGALIGPNTVIGSNVIVDRQSVVTNSILMSDTFIGQQLEVERKIAEGNLLIDPDSGASLLMHEPHLMSPIGQFSTGSQIIRSVVHRLFALVLLLLLALPYLLLAPFAATGENKPGNAAAAWLFELLQLDRYPLLFRVITGSMSLIGHRSHNAAGEADAARAPTSKQAVFAYAEAEEWPETEADTMIVDHYYAQHSTPLNDIGMTLKTFINRNPLSKRSTP